jgi:hypothetical protein
LIKYLFAILLFSSVSVSAQRLKNNPKVSYDSIHVKGNRFIFIEDYAYYAHQDTVFVLLDTAEFHIRKNNLERTDKFYKSVESRMSKGKVSSLMYQYLFKTDKSVEPHDDESSSQRFYPYQNETITNIGYKYLNVFGSDINDTTKNNPNKWTNILNRSHVHTRKWVLRKNLLFKKNQRIIAENFVDSERLLRRLDYVKDARIYVLDQKSSKDSKVLVTSKDVFPYNFLINPNNDNGAKFGISNINIAGTGHELEYDNIADGGSDYYYRVRNVEGTFIDTELNYANYFRKNGFGISLKRDFLTQETKYAGGAAFSRYKFTETDFNPITDVTNTINYDLQYRDLWVGKAFETSVVSKLLGLKENTNAVVSFRVENSLFSNAPVADDFTNFRFHNRANYLLNIGLTSRVYYKDKFILLFGRTEDIPTGSAFGLVTGYQNGAFRNRVYLGVNFARGGYIPKFGYLNSIFSLGSFISNKEINDGVLKIGVDYFTKLFSFNQFKFRQFIELNFSQTIRPSEEIVLITQNDLGIRGISNYYHRSTTKFNIKLESLLFTPYNVLGFNMAILGFFDLTTTSNNKNTLFSNDVFAGMGGGIRLRNDNLAISTIQLRLGYYPSLPINGFSNLLNAATSTNLNIRDFNFGAPEIISFQ